MGHYSLYALPVSYGIRERNLGKTLEFAYIHPLLPHLFSALYTACTAISWSYIPGTSNSVCDKIVKDPSPTNMHFQMSTTDGDERAESTSENHIWGVAGKEWYFFRYDTLLAKGGELLSFTIELRDDLHICVEQLEIWVFDE